MQAQPDQLISDYVLREAMGTPASETEFRHFHIKALLEKVADDLRPFDGSDREFQGHIVERLDALVRREPQLVEHLYHWGIAQLVQATYPDEG